jgi:GLPGLI family protein
VGNNEGIIEYRIIYLQDKVGGYSSAVLPQSMIIQFSKGKLKTTIDGALGFFRLVNIADLHELRNITYLKFLDKKYIYIGKKKERACCFGFPENMKIEFSGNTKEVAGFHCEEAIASFPDSKTESFTIYYTNEIKVKKPNATSPYYQIPGVMMEFNTSMGDARMRVIAQVYKPVRIPDKEFSIPDGYRPVSKSEIENILHALMK